MFIHLEFNGWIKPSHSFQDCIIWAEYIYLYERPSHMEPLKVHCCIWMLVDSITTGDIERFCTSAPTESSPDEMEWCHLWTVSKASSTLNDVHWIASGHNGDDENILHLRQMKCYSLYNILMFSSFYTDVYGRTILLTRCLKTLVWFIWYFIQLYSVFFSDFLNFIQLFRLFCLKFILV